MLIPCIDLMGGKVVQLVQGEKMALEFSDSEPWIRKFEKYSLVHIVDLDAAKRQGSNRKLVSDISKRLNCQVGGGVSDLATAREILAGGAKRVVVGSALISGDEVDTEFAKRLADEIGPDKLVFSVDTKNGSIAVSGWTKTVPITPEDAIRKLEPYCASFLYTHVDTEGGLGGFPIHVARRLVQTTKKSLIVGGGIRSMDEVEELHSINEEARTITTYVDRQPEVQRRAETRAS
jgi:phosphoribosylformimino-5-aminoimidazole carboxamide ribotide isomerase